MRPMTVKQAQKWLEKVKNSNVNSFKQLSKILKRYQRNGDDYQCFVKVNTTLLEHPELTAEVNSFLEQGNKFVINQSQVDKINDLVKYIKRVDFNSFQQIASYITKLHSQRKNSTEKDLDEEKMNKLIRDQVLNQVKGKPELQAYAHKALTMSASELIKQLDLSHLKQSKIVEQAAQKVEEYVEPVFQPSVPEQSEPPQQKQKIFPPFLNQNEQKYFFRQFEASADAQIYETVLKIIHIYHLGILSRIETLQLLKPHLGQDYPAFKDLIQSRENDRRRNSCFRSLNDMDYSGVQRATHSYVRMPDVYPHHCSNNTPISLEVLNKSWVTVPRGTQETFNIRVKNSYEENLMRAQDDRYQFDIYCRRLAKSVEILEDVLKRIQEKNQSSQKNQKKNQDQLAPLIQKVISLGIIQTLYKNATKDQREEIQFYLRNMRHETLSVFYSRLKSQQTQLQEMRNIHGLRTWSDVANKNWKKSLDLKGHEFKRIEKLKMKAGVFLEQLKTRVNYLKSRGQNGSFDTYFEEKRQFFSILNSFETSSRKERCLNRNLPTPKTYNIKTHPLPTLLPAMVLSFEDGQVLSLVYSFVVYYIDHAIVNQSQRTRCKTTFKQIMGQFFGMKQFQYRYLSASFEQEKFFSELNSENSTQTLNNWISTESQQFANVLPSQRRTDDDEIIPKLNFLSQDHKNQYSFEPPKQKNNQVFYAGQNFYVFVRFLYALFERIIRMKQVAQSKRKQTLFEILYYICIKSRESAKYEQILNTLFSDHAYLFTTFYKLLQNLQKSINIVSTCALYSYSLKLFSSNNRSQQIYLLLLNKFILSSTNPSTKLMRFTYERGTTLLYVNWLQSYYKNEDQCKDLQKRRLDIAMKIQLYVVMANLKGIQIGKEFLREAKEIKESKDGNKQQNNTKVNEGPRSEIDKNTKWRNSMEYCFQGNSIKMVNLCHKEDLLVSSRVPQSKQNLLEQINKVKSVRDRFV